MTDINPPARTRIRPVVTATPLPVSTVTARPRVRPLPVDPNQRVEVAPRARVRPEPSGKPAPNPDNPWYIPPGARPLGVLQKTHNGAEPRGADLPDPRFKPLLIILPELARKTCTSYVAYRLDEAMAWKVADVAKLPAMIASNAYITEFGLRHYLKYRILSEDIYDALRERLFKLWDESDPKTMIFAGSKSMMTRTEDGDLICDLNKNAGPFYCESLLAIERHYKKHLQPVAA